MIGRLPLLTIAVAVVVLPLAGGCGRPVGTVTGAVSYQDKPVARGSITFFPEDGKGPSCGGPITEGRYQVANVPPGRKLAQIVGVKAVNFARSSEEMERASKQAANQPDNTGIIERADVVPPNAEGNNVVIEVAAGQQVRDFHLQPPK